MQFKNIYHVMRDSFRLFLCNFGCHDGGVLVELLRVAADYFTLKVFGEFNAELGLSYPRSANDEDAKHINYQRNSTNKEIKQL